MGISNKHYRHIHLPEFDYLFQISHISTPVVEFRYIVLSYYQQSPEDGCNL